LLSRFSLHKLGMVSEPVLIFILIKFFCLKHCLIIRTNVPRKEGGLGDLDIPILSDLTHTISKDYGVYLEDNGHSLRGLFIIDDKGVLRQITMNDLPVGRLKLIGCKLYVVLKQYIISGL